MTNCRQHMTFYQFTGSECSIYLRNWKATTTILYIGITRVSVTRGSNWGCHPWFSFDDLFSPSASSPVSPLFIFFWKNLRPFFANHYHFYWFQSSVNPWRVSPRTFFYLSDLVCPLFFVNLPTTHSFCSGVTPWRVSVTRGGPPLVTPLIL